MPRRRSPIAWIAVLAMLVVSPSAFAQAGTGSIRGVVSDREFGSPLESAQVFVVETGGTVSTTDDGHFVFADAPPGRYTLIVSREGYVRQVKAGVVVEAGRLAEVDVALVGEFTEMEEFVVQDILQLAAGTEAVLLQLRFESAALMDSISAELMSRAGATDAAAALRLVAGASVQDGKSAVIRGLPDRYVSNQMNGVRLPTADEDKRAVELDQFPAAIIESIQVSKTFTPDQQGDASGGAVNVRLKGIPDETVLQVRGGTTYHSQTTGRSDLLTYRGGGVDFWGREGGREIQNGNLGDNWNGAVGVSRDDAPIDHKFSAALGGKREVDKGLAFGGLFSVFHENDSSAIDRGRDDSKWVTSPGAGMSPETTQGTPSQGDFKTALYDVWQGTQSVQWGTLAAVGVKADEHSLDFAYLYTRTAEDTATLLQDTRGKKHFFPGYDPNDPTTPGHREATAAPYLRLETLEYTERTTDTLQLGGRHRFPFEDLGILRAAEIDWILSHSSAGLDSPDKRQFGSLWLPETQAGPFLVPATHAPYKPAANFNLGNLQRIWKEIEEESDQVAVNLKLPFEAWGEREGYVKFGVFHDSLDRAFDQNTFSNFGDNSNFQGEFGEFWSRRFPMEDHPVSAANTDVDYRGEQEIAARYAMLSLPLPATMTLIGGVRLESTELGVVNDAESEATWFPPGSSVGIQLNPGDADVEFREVHLLPSIALEVRPVRPVTLRASYNETVARQTFKELTPILQQEYYGGPIFIGNPSLEMSELKNYDLRLDVVPEEGALLSASWFRKDVRKPIEYVQRLASFTYTTAVNYPKGELTGWEIEGRQKLGRLWGTLDGLALGANATFIESEVTLPDEEADSFNHPSIQAPMRTRDMTNAPEHLYNLFLTYDLAATGTQAAIFYTVQGDTLVAGATQSVGNFVPSVYAKEYGTLNASVSQRLGKFFKVQLQGKNLTDPKIETAYRSPYIGDDVTRTSYHKGIEVSLSLGAEVRF